MGLFSTVCMVSLEARGGVYYVTVAGLGGEPDYEQRFTAAARDLDKVSRDTRTTAHVYTFTGAQATASLQKDSPNH